jgi:hypothetical protein
MTKLKSVKCTEKEPVCGECAKFRSMDPYWGKCPMDLPKAVRSINVLVSRALDGKHGFERCWEFEPSATNPCVPGAPKEAEQDAPQS